MVFHKWKLLPLCVAWAIGLPVIAQQPFYTDDADVTPQRQFHFELIDQFTLLQRSAFPSLRQNAVVYQLNYGLGRGLEVGVDSPLLAIINAPETVTPRIPVGIGDTNVTCKWNFLEEREGSRRPALTVAFAVEVPTGNTSTQLGSGLADYTLNGILQKELSRKTTLRINQGVLFSGNTLTGVVGLAARGTVYTAGASLVRQIHARLELGIEVNAAVAHSALLGKASLQTQFAGKYSLSDTLALDWGIVGGRFANSPRLGLQFGVSKDF